MTPDLLTPENCTVLLGRKPLRLPPPITVEVTHDWETVDFGPDPITGEAHPSLTILRGSIVRILAGGHPVATTRRFVLKQDKRSGHLTLRLFKNKTTLH